VHKWLKAATTPVDIFDSMRGRSRFVLSLVRLKPFGDATPEDRSNERYRRVALSALAAAGARAISIVTLLVSVPLTVRYLGSERYGMWTTIGSLIAILSFADLGIGNGLLNAIAESHGRDDRDAARRYVSSAFFMLAGLALLLGSLFALIYRQVSWRTIFNVSTSEAIAEAGPATAVFVGCFLVSIPLGIVQRIQRGYQEGFIDSSWIAAGKLIGLGGVLLVIWLKGGLPWLVLALAGGPALALLLNSIVLFGVRRPWLYPRWRYVRSHYARRILHLGSLFFVLSVASAVAYSADSIVVAQIIGPEAVTDYAVAMQMFSLAPLMLAMLLEPLWPAYGEALARGDTSWIRSTFRRSLAIGLLLNGPYALLATVLGVQIVHLWVGTGVTPTRLLLAAFGVWTLLNSLSGAMAMLFNGMNIIRFQVICALLMAGSNLALSIVLTRQIGVSGVIWGSVIAQAVFVLLPGAFYIMRLFSALPQPDTHTA
jgi:O-antigen/teichoic acid export membrane protein